MKTAPASLLFLGLWAAVAHAQPAGAPPPPKPDDPAWNRALQAKREAQRATSFRSNRVAPDSGFYYLLKAAESLLPNPKPRPGSPGAFAAYHAGSLRVLRIALQKDIVRPLVDGQPFETQMNWGGGLSYDENFRRLAEILDNESSGRLAGGDARGALDSRLDCLQLGVLVADGTLADLNESLIEAEIGSADIEDIAALLDARACRAAAARLTAIEARRATFGATSRAEAAHLGEVLRDSLFDAENRQILATVEGRWFFGYYQAHVSEALAQQVLALTPAQTREITDQFYEAVVQSVVKPFQKSKDMAVVPTPQFSLLDTIFLGNTGAKSLFLPNIRFNYEQSALRTHFIRCALELRALKLETGAYPNHFEAGIDPFSFPLQPLKYRRDGDKYQLYSVGPDGQDNGGAEIETISVDRQTGEKAVSDRLSINSTGDILAPIF